MQLCSCAQIQLNKTEKNKSNPHLYPLKQDKHFCLQTFMNATTWISFTPCFVASIYSFIFFPPVCPFSSCFLFLFQSHLFKEVARLLLKALL